jgi:hypothetical protein
MSNHTIVSEFLRVIFDRKWHALYEMHVRFHMNAIEIYDAASILQGLNIIERRGMEVRICASLNEQQLSIINRMLKTARPSKLDAFSPNPLTRRKKSVSYAGRLEH